MGYHGKKATRCRETANQSSAIGSSKCDTKFLKPQLDPVSVCVCKKLFEDEVEIRVFKYTHFSTPTRTHGRTHPTKNRTNLFFFNLQKKSKFYDSYHDIYEKNLFYFVEYIKVCNFF